MDRENGFLDKTFNNFFPQSQTVGKGIFLYRLAWAIEIIIACIGATLGFLIMRKSQGYENLDESLLQSMDLDSFMMGMIFFIVAIVEITKIPLASAVYYSRKTMWTIIFIFALIAVNVSTFETIVTGFERINNNRTYDIKKLIIKKTTLEQQLTQKGLTVSSDNLTKQINEKIKENNELQNQIISYEETAQKQRNRISEQSNNRSEINALNKQNDVFETNRKDLVDSIKDTKNELSKQKGFFTSRKVLTNTLINDQKRLDDLNNKIIINNERIGQLEKLDSSDSQGKIDFVNKQLANQTINQRRQIEQNLLLISNLTKSQSEEAKDQYNERKDIKKIKEEIRNTINEIDRLAPENQVYRVATWFKSWFLVDFDKVNRQIENDIISLERSKFKDNFLLLFEVNKIASISESKQIDNKISQLNEQIIENNEKLRIQRNTTGSQSAYSNLPEEALTFAFWIWFGVLSFIISITGTLLAFASLNLQDPRLQEILNKPNTGLSGLTYRLSKLLTAYRRYLVNKVKFYMKPRKEKIVEVEKIIEKPIQVEKIVEKIVEKPVIEEKIVIQTVEVPKEIEKKVFVHVPFPTDDQEIIKKGPVIYNDKDKK
jgi:hypothetical protein